MVDDSKTQKINIGEIIKDPEMLEFVDDYLNTKKMCKHAVQKLPFLIKCVPDKYETQQMCYKTIL